MAKPYVSETPPTRDVHSSPAPYVDVDKLRNAEGLVAIISQRRANGTFTFGIFKEFERDGQTERTGFVPAEMAESYIALVRIAVERIERIRATGKAPFPIGDRSR